MGITVVSPAASALATLAGDASATTAATATDSGGIDFAALFAIQIGDFGKVISTDNSKPLTAKEDTSEKQAASETPTDPSLILAGMLPLNGDALPPRPLTSKPEEPKIQEEETQGDQRGLAAANLGLGTSSDKGKPGSESDPQLRAEPLAIAGQALGLSSSKTDAANSASVAADKENSIGANFATTLAQQTTAPKVTPGTDNQKQITTPLHDANWSQDFSSKIVWLAKNDQQSAQLNINPPQLGPMQINLQVSGDQVSAQFFSPHAEVRQAIQDAMPQLREMLAGAGIDLGQANVGAQLAGRESQKPQPNSPRGQSDNAILAGEFGQSSAGTPTTSAQSGRGLVDLFA